MSKIKYVGLLAKGLTVHLPYPFTSMSGNQTDVTFAAPGDVQDVDAKYAGDLFTRGGGQFEFVEKEKAPSAVEAVEAVEPELGGAKRSQGFGFHGKKTN